MRYDFPMVKWEGCFQSFDDILLSIDSAIQAADQSRIARKRKALIIGTLKAARDEIGHLRWELKEKK